MIWPDSHFAVVIIARISTILLGVVVLVVTLTATCRTKRCANDAHVRVPLTTLLIRDGKQHVFSALDPNWSSYMRCRREIFFVSRLSLWENGISVRLTADSAESYWWWPLQNWLYFMLRWGRRRICFCAQLTCPSIEAGLSIIILLLVSTIPDPRTLVLFQVSDHTSQIDRHPHLKIFPRSTSNRSRTYRGSRTLYTLAIRAAELLCFLRLQCWC